MIKLLKRFYYCLLGLPYADWKPIGQYLLERGKYYLVASKGGHVYTGYIDPNSDKEVWILFRVEVDGKPFLFSIENVLFFAEIPRNYPEEVNVTN